MTIKITFKHLPRAGRFTRGNKYYVRYNTKGSVHDPENKTHDYRLPKFLWDRL